jgi:hypothetical protein
MNDYEKWKTEQQFQRYRKRREVKELLRKHRGKRRSVRAVSGGLPSLGKRR